MGFAQIARSLLVAIGFFGFGLQGTFAQTGTIDPDSIPKFVTPLVIPPVMMNDGTANDYDIAVRQFQQQILPGGIWNTLNGRDDAFPPTTVWSYGPTAQNAPAVAPDPSSQFNYPAYTIETTAGVPVRVVWRNKLMNGAGNFLPHLLAIDQTLHWANPPQVGCRDATTRPDCATNQPEPYTGPVPIVTHVHGAHADAHSDGYPEAWWLPDANDIPAGYARQGSKFDDADGRAQANGYAAYEYRQDQPATTLWYHDHTLGMTRANVYAGPAGFWLVRGGPHDVVAWQNNPERLARLPGPAPMPGQSVLDLNVPSSPVRAAIREIPIAIQDRTFKSDGSLFYPDNRAFFESLNVPGQPEQFPGEPDLDIETVPASDIAPIWNPEVFSNSIVVNGVTWPLLEVAPARYRFRLLNGCNSRFLNLALVYSEKVRRRMIRRELPFIQVGAEQGFLPRPVEVLTGFATPILDGKVPGAASRVPAPHPQQALLMGPAERADVIVDFSKVPDGTLVTMTNTAPDEPFGGFPAVPADPDTTGQVMRFVVNAQRILPDDALTTDPYKLLPIAEGAIGAASATRQVSLNEEESAQVCVTVDAEGNMSQLPDETPPCETGEVFGPREALLGKVVDPSGDPSGIPLKWTDITGASTPVQFTLQNGAAVTVNVSENPSVGATEDWEMYNFTADAHPIHLHLVRFQVMGRRAIPGFEPVAPVVLPSETGFKDTVIAYPGEITTVRATFDLEGLYVWHCHIVEHEDNEMMRPYAVGGAAPALEATASSSQRRRRR